MKKILGFTVLETLTVIGILGILAAITIPSFDGWRKEEIFSQKVDRVFTMIDVAKGNAQNKKNCSGDQESERWIVEFDLKNEPKKFRLLCQHSGGTSVEEPTDSSDRDYIFDENQVIPWFFRIDTNEQGKTEAAESIYTLEFLSETERLIINHELSGDDFTVKEARINLQYAPDPATQQTICIDRVEMYSHISLEYDVCVEYPVFSGECSLSSSIGDLCGGGVYAGSSLIARPADGGSTKWDDAILYCENLIAQTYDDWYLPDQTKLQILYDHQLTIGGFEGRPWPYWSSDEASGNSAYTINFQTGDQSTPNKNSNKQVRCVRNDS